MLDALRCPPPSTDCFELLRAALNELRPPPKRCSSRRLAHTLGAQRLVRLPRGRSIVRLMAVARDCRIFKPERADGEAPVLTGNPTRRGCRGWGASVAGVRWISQLPTTYNQYHGKQAQVGNQAQPILRSRQRSLRSREQRSRASSLTQFPVQLANAAYGATVITAATLATKFDATRETTKILTICSSGYDCCRENTVREPTVSMSLILASRFKAQRKLAVTFYSSPQPPVAGQEDAGIDIAETIVVAGSRNSAIGFAARWQGVPAASPNSF